MLAAATKLEPIQTDKVIKGHDVPPVLILGAAEINTRAMRRYVCWKLIYDLSA